MYVYVLVLSMFMVALFTLCYFDMELIIGIRIFEVEFELVCIIGIDIK